MNKADKVYVAGHHGLVGSAILRALQKEHFQNLVTRSRAELDLRDSAAVADFFKNEKPDYVFLAAARVGGIMANATQPVEHLLENLEIQNNVIPNAFAVGVKKLLFLGSACVYPRLAPQPIKEEHLLTGQLEPTNSAYAIAKIAGIEMCQAYHNEYGANFISIMPNNLYGPNDNFDLNTSHVLPALIRKFHEAKVAGHSNVQVWGNGTPLREFLHVDDLADASLFLMQHYNDSALINVGSGEEISIHELAETIRDVVGYTGEIVWDTTKPNGIPRKLLDISKLNALGWKATIPLQEGIETTYAWYVENYIKS